MSSRPSPAPVRAWRTAAISARVQSRRVLLGPAAGGVAHRAGRARRGERAALVVGDHRLDALGADVDPDHAAHATRPRPVRGRARPRRWRAPRRPARAAPAGCVASHCAPAAISTTQITISHGNHVYGRTVCSRIWPTSSATISAAPPSGSTPWRITLEAPAGGEVARRGEVGQHVDREDPERQQEAEVAVDVRAAGRVAEAAARPRRRRAPARARRRRWRRSRTTACAAWGR